MSRASAERERRVRIDGTSYADGWFDCVVVIDGTEVHRTKRFKMHDADGTHPGMRAMRAARDWIARQRDESGG